MNKNLYTRAAIALAILCLAALPGMGQKQSVEEQFPHNYAVNDSMTQAIYEQVQQAAAAKEAAKKDQYGLALIKAIQENKDGQNNSRIEWLLPRANMNVQDEKGRTPLYVAIFHHYPKLAEQMIKKYGADGSVGQDTGYPALYAAVANGYEALVDCLLKQPGVDLTPVLYRTIVEERDHIVGLLLQQSDKNVNILNGKNQTILHLLAEHDMSGFPLDQALKKGLDVNARDNDGKTPLLSVPFGVMKCVTRGVNGHYFDVNIYSSMSPAKQLIAAGADVFAEDKFGNNFIINLFENSFREDRVDLSLYLIKKYGEDPRFCKLTTKNGETLLYLDSPEILNALLTKCDIDLNAQDNNGETLLHKAVLLERIDKVYMLLEQKGRININIKNNAGKTPLAIALERNDGRTASLLLDHGAHK